MSNPRILSHWDRLSDAERDAYQLRQLRRILATRVVPFSELYRRRFRDHGIDPRSIKTWNDVARIPFTTKADLLPSEANPDGPKALILRPTPELIREELPLGAKLALLSKRVLRGKQRLQAELLAEFVPTGMTFTTGRSSGSIPFFTTNFDVDLMKETGRRMVDVLRLHPTKDRIINMFPYAPHLAFWQVAYVALGGGVLTFNTGGGRVMGPDRLLAAMESFKPTVAVGMPGYFYHLTRRAVDEGTDLSSLRIVALGGENVPPGFKRRLRELLIRAGASDPVVVSVLGFTEARQCWTECAGARRTGFHTSPDLGLFEIIDPDTGERLPEDTTGELVYTSLEGRGSMVVRYRTGDIVEGGLSTKPCPGCGRTVPRIMSSIRRVSNVKSLDIGKIKGTLVNLNDVAALIAETDEVEEWQLVIQKKDDDPFERDELELLVALRQGTDEASFLEHVQREMRSRAEVTIDRVRVEPLEKLLDRVGMEDKIKEERIVDRRPKTSASEAGVSS